MTAATAAVVDPSPTARIGSNPQKGASVGDDFVAVVDERADARVALVLVDGVGLALLDLVLDVVGARAVITDPYVLRDVGVQRVVVVVLVLEFADPLGARSVTRTLSVLVGTKIAQRFSNVEDDLDVVAGVVELRGGLETVDDAAEVGRRFRTGENDDRCVWHVTATRIPARMPVGRSCAGRPRATAPTGGVFR